MKLFFGLGIAFALSGFRPSATADTGRPLDLRLPRPSVDEIHELSFVPIQAIRDRQGAVVCRLSSLDHTRRPASTDLTFLISDLDGYQECAVRGGLVDRGGARDLNALDIRSASFPKSVPAPKARF